jgi:hypothetical protein
MTKFKTVQEFKDTLRQQRPGDPLGVGSDPELRIGLMDATFTRYLRGSPDALKEWADLVESELASDDWMAQHTETTQPEMDAHEYFYKIYRRSIP